ncbi:tetraacyldisaccharide 4'-kinase [Kaarinaea lacus]
MLLLPLSILYCVVSWVRRTLYNFNILNSSSLAVPVIVVGNISVGGTGKTPLVIAITQYLKANGFNPGVISRGYGGSASQWPQAVSPESDPALVGDETVLIANRCRCPVSVGPDRVAAANALLADHQCDVIVSDDGLQHYAMKRDIEIVVIDGERRLGNRLCLPAGPLRELPSRLRTVDMLVTNGDAKADEFSMQLKAYAFHSVNNDTELKPLNAFEGVHVDAVSGIGNNERFFRQIHDLGIHVHKHPFQDHHQYKLKDISFSDQKPILMTEKDAVKCQKFSLKDAWYLRVDACLENRFYETMTSLIRKTNG